MKKITRNETDFAEIFKFAEEISGVSWNNANDLFFDKGYADFYREEIKHDLEYEKKELIPPTKVDNSNGRSWFRANSTIAYQIIYQFMLKHEVEEMRIFGD